MTMPETGNRKHILFFSNFCNHSKEVLGAITKKNVGSQFVFVCVDENRYKLPWFVDRVPMICTSSKQPLADKEIFNFLDTMNTGDVEACGHFWKYGSMSDQFSFIEEDAAPVHNFVYIGNEPSIQTPEEVSTSTRIDQKSYESYVSQRENDIIGMQKMQQRV